VGDERGRVTRWRAARPARWTRRVALFGPLFDALNRDAAGFEDARAVLRERVLAATPAERLAWLEEAIAPAHRTGALPRRPGADA
jgi:hypothetical protein